MTAELNCADTEVSVFTHFCYKVCTSFVLKSIVLKFGLQLVYFEDLPLVYLH